MTDVLIPAGLLALSLLIALYPSHRILNRSSVWWSYGRILQHHDVRWRAWRSSHHLIDFVRGWAALALGRLVLMILPPGWELPSPDVGFLSLAAVGILGTFFQMRCPEREEGLQAPIAFTAGLMFGLLPPLIALSAVVFGLASAFAFRALPVYFLFSGGVAGGLGIAFKQPKIAVGCSVLVAVTPLAIAFMRQQKFLIRLPKKALRERRIKGGASSPMREVG